MAQHCINCAAEAYARGYSKAVQLACLLHDAAEAYVCDIPRPIKNNMTDFCLVEDRLLDMIYRKYEIDTGNDARWHEIIRSLEYLDEAHRALFLNAAEMPTEISTAKEKVCERFLAYLIYRHCTEAFDDTDFRERLSFCLFCERLLSSLICSERAGTLREIAALASILSEEIEYSEDNTFAITFDY